AAALAVLDQMRPLADGSGIVFGGRHRGRPLATDAFLRLLARMNIPVTAHGFRATFKTWASECTGFPREIVEASLTHVSPDQPERAYRRGSFFDKRRILMVEWAAYCAAPGAAAATVLPLPGRTAAR